MKINIYEIGQTVYWVKYSYNIPGIYSFKIGCIKHDKLGYKYSDGQPGSSYIQESDLLLSKPEVIDNACNRLRRLLDE